MAGQAVVLASLAGQAVFRSGLLIFRAVGIAEVESSVHFDSLMKSAGSLTRFIITTQVAPIAFWPQAVAKRAVLKKQGNSCDHGERDCSLHEQNIIELAKSS